MKCPNCKNEMINTIGGCYHCEKCGYAEHDLVYRNSNIPPQTTEEVKENKLVIGDPYVGSDGPYTPTRGSYQIHSVIPKQYGWECPKCGAVMSPDQKTCPFCSPRVNVSGGNFIC